MTPDLAAQLATFERQLATAPPEEIPAILGELRRLEATLWSRMTSAAASDGQPEAPANPDRWLKVEDAAAIANIPATWFYRNWKRLRFAKKISHRMLRLSEAGLRRWLAEKRP